MEADQASLPAGRSVLRALRAAARLRRGHTLRFSKWGDQLCEVDNASAAPYHWSLILPKELFVLHRTLTCSLAIVAIGTGCATTRTSNPTAIAAPASSETVPISQVEIEAAQRAWCAGLIAIGAASPETAQAKANEVLSSAYHYDAGITLFKPTLAHGAQTFRFDKRGALAYFVGGDSSYPDDHGFALKPWSVCEPKVSGVFAHGDIALAMGNVVLTDSKGGKTVVDKSFGYLRDRDGRLHIVLHHSSLPFDPQK